MGWGWTNKAIGWLGSRSKPCPSVVEGKPDTETKATSANKSKSKQKSGPATPESTALAEKREIEQATAPSSTQYEPRIVQQTGLYPEDKQTRLEESRKKTPIYLFRASRPSSGSGIEVRDEDSVKMVPRACVNGAAAHDNVYLIPELENMLNGHLKEVTTIQSEFSSWTANFRTAVHFYDCHKDHQARISVIDTRQYPNTGIYHVPNLCEVGLASDTYDHEYLVHGVVDGGPVSGYYSISWDQSMTKKFDRMILHAPLYFTPSIVDPRVQEQDISPLTKKELQTAIRMATKFEPKFIIPLVASLLSHKPRSWRHPKSRLASRDVQTIVKALKKTPAPAIEDYSKVINIAADVVYIDGYQEIKQMNLLLQLLAERSYAKGKKETGKGRRSKEGWQGRGWHGLHG